MGLCGSKADNPNPATSEKNKRLEKTLQNRKEKDSLVAKLLLLGAGESGKSTFFKQVQELYGEGFSVQDRMQMVPIIHGNMIAQMQILLEQSTRFAAEDNSFTVAAENQQFADHVNEMKNNGPITPDDADAFKALWGDAGIQAAYARRSMFQLNDATKYFLDKVDEVAKPDYCPPVDDVIRVRVRTTGIVECNFTIDKTKFSMFDVGGQRNERKKWIHCFDGVTAVLFVAAISGYDQVLFEDEQQNRMAEARQLFEEVANSQWFSNTSIILFLNKKDLFEKKIKEVPLTVCFPEYTGSNDVNEAAAYIEQQFLKLRRNERKVVYTHLTCATDRDNVNVIFVAVKDIVIRRSLNEGGLMLSV